MVSAHNRGEGRRHRFAAELLARLGRTLLVPWPVFVEVDLLLRARGHADAAVNFARALLEGVHRLDAPTDAELAMALDLADRYADAGLDLPDVTVMAMAAKRPQASPVAVNGRSSQRGGPAGGSPRFADLPLQAGETLGVGSQLGGQHLDADLAIEPIVTGAIHFSHAASPERLEDLVMTQLIADHSVSLGNLGRIVLANRCGATGEPGLAAMDSSDAVAFDELVR